MSGRLLYTMYQSNIPLSSLSTLKVGGSASHFVAVHSVEELQAVIDRNKEEKLPILVLGGGSNVLFADEGWNGLVIRIEIGGIKWEEEGEYTRAIVGGGVVWDDLVRESVEKGLYGLENLSSIPGTVGASPIQNIGAYGTEASEVIEWVKAVHRDTGEIRVFNNDECRFSYRNSFFKTPEGGVWIVVEVSFLLKERGELNTSYADVEKYLKEREIVNPTLLDIRNAVVEIRQSKFPNLQEFGTAGSFFKNPIVSSELYEKLTVEYPDMPGYEAPGGVKVSLAWILDHILGLKGYNQGNVGLHARQPLVVVTKDGARSADVKELALYIQKRVKETTDIDIEPEVRFIG